LLINSAPVNLYRKEPDEQNNSHNNQAPILVKPPSVEDYQANVFHADQNNMIIGEKYVVGDPNIIPE
jgi:hypothetical protein